MSRRLAGYERVGQLDELHGLALPNLDTCAPKSAAPISSGEAKGLERRQRVGEIFARAPHQAHANSLPRSILLLLVVIILLSWFFSRGPPSRQGSPSPIHGLGARHRACPRPPARLRPNMGETHVWAKHMFGRKHMFGLAAAQGDAEAQYTLGYMHHVGQGGPVDFAEARRLYGLAAAQGVAEAQYFLGCMHRRGEGGPVDLAEARRLFGLAAAQGYAAAQVRAAMARYRAITHGLLGRRPSRGAAMVRR